MVLLALQFGQRHLLQLDHNTDIVLSLNILAKILPPILKIFTVQMNTLFIGFSMFLFSMYVLVFHVSHKTPGTKIPRIFLLSTSALTCSYMDTKNNKNY